MKKNLLCVMLCIALLCLSGCGSKGPTTAADGTPWDDAWIMVGSKIGAEDPGADFTLRDMKGAKGLFFTSWSVGEARPYTNAQGEETDVYDAQLVLLVQEVSTPELAQTSVDEWLALAEDAYTVTATTQQTLGGQAFTVLTYDFPADTGSYARGASAFAIYETCAVSAEFACQDSFEGDAESVLTDFLEHCHYAAD